MAAWRSALAVLALGLSLPLVAAAQATPSAEPAAPPDVAETSAARSWQVEAEALGIVDSNVSFQSPDSPGDYGVSLAARLGRLFRSPHGELRLGLDGDALLYRELTEFDHLDGALRLAGTHRSSPALSWTYGANAAYQTTDALPILIDQGLQLERAHATSLGANGGLDYRFSRRTSLRADGQYERIAFDTEDLVDTDSAEGRLALVRRVGPRDELQPAYGFRYVGGATEHDALHELTLRWNRLPARGLAFDVTGGAAYAPARLLRPQGQWFFVGSAGVQRQVRRTALSARLSREGTPAYGLGDLQLSDILSLTASAPFGRRLTLVGAAISARNRDLGNGLRRETSHYASVSLAYRFLRRTSLVLGYRYRYLHDDVAGAGAPVDSHRASFGIAYERP
jgi:hypothetical protein